MNVIVAKVDKAVVETLPECREFDTPQGRGAVSTKGLVEADEFIAGLEKMPPGKTLDWSFVLPEAYYILEGKCELTFSSPPFEKWEVSICEKGDVVYLPTGVRVKHKVISNEPLVLISFHYPPGSILNSIKLKRALGIS